MCVCVCVREKSQTVRVPCVQCDGAGSVNADPYCLRSPSQEVQQSVAQRGVEPQLDQFVSELLRDDCVKMLN